MGVEYIGYTQSFIAYMYATTLYYVYIHVTTKTTTTTSKYAQAKYHRGVVMAGLALTKFTE